MLAADQITRTSQPLLSAFHGVYRLSQPSFYSLACSSFRSPQDGLLQKIDGKKQSRLWPIFTVAEISIIPRS
jgi:hypothetical protein